MPVNVIATWLDVPGTRADVAFSRQMVDERAVACPSAPVGCGYCRLRLIKLCSLSPDLPSARPSNAPPNTAPTG
jgi:hypothetical protein